MAEGSGKTPYPVRIITPEGMVFDDEVRLLLVTGTGGNVGFFARHAPLVADLKMGYVKVHLANDEWRGWATAEGFAKVHDSQGLVLVEEAVALDEIDVAEAEKIIQDSQDELERAEAQAAARSDDDDSVYQADADKARRGIEWGEHLKAMASEALAGATH